MKREVCSADIRSVESMKITPSQMVTGSQYLRKVLTHLIKCAEFKQGVAVDK